MFLGIWDGPQLHWASLLLSGGNKKPGSCWRVGIFCLFEGTQRRRDTTEGTDSVL